MFLLSIAAIAALISGCAAYQWGEPGHKAVRTIYLTPVENRTEIPQIRALLTEQLRQTLVQQPRWTLASEAEAEVVLSVVVTLVESRTAASREDDTGRGASFSVTLQAESILRMAGPERPARTVRVEGLLFDAPGQTAVAYQALPAMTQKLAEQIVEQASSDAP